MSIAEASTAAHTGEEGTTAIPHHEDHLHTRNEAHIHHEVTTSVNRSYSDLDPTRFVFFVVILCALRTAIQHPLNLALARKQSMPKLANASTKVILSDLIAKEGWRRGLTRGITAFVGGTAASEGIYLVTFELLREFLPISLDITREAASGYMSDALCRSVHIPLMVVAYRQMSYEQPQITKQAPKIATQSVTAKKPLLPFFSFLGTKASPAPLQGSSCPRIPAVVRSVYKEGGLRALYAGMGTTLLIGCQWSGVWWAMYGYLKYPLYHGSERLIRGWDSYDDRGHYIGNLKPSRDSSVTATTGTDDDRNALVSYLRPAYCRLPSWVQSGFNRHDNMLLNGIASVCASGFSAVVFNPFLVLRARIQVQSGLSLRQAIRDVYREGGTAAKNSGGASSATVGGPYKHGSYKGFFSGLRLSVTLCIVDGVFSTFCYEYSKLWSDVSNIQKKIHQ